MAQARPCWSRLGVPGFVDHSATLLGKGICPENAMLRRQRARCHGCLSRDDTPTADSSVKEGQKRKGKFEHYLESQKRKCARGTS